nr:hypothetical protein [Clostridium thermarum]
MGSMRKNGNTKTLLDPFIEELMKEKATVQYIWIYDKYCAVISTCGYELDNGADLFEEAIKRLSIHSQLNYIGILAVRDINGVTDFQTNDVINSSKEFAIRILDTCK